MSKNKFAVALGKLKAGVKEKRSKRKTATARKNLILARKNRWKKK